MMDGGVWGGEIFGDHEISVSKFMSDLYPKYFSISSLEQNLKQTVNFPAKPIVSVKFFGRAFAKRKLHIHKIALASRLVRVLLVLHAAPVRSLRLGPAGLCSKAIT